TKLSRSQVNYTEDEVRKAFEAHYGEKLDGRLILYPTDQLTRARGEYARLRDSEEAFADLAKKQPMSNLASAGGKINPFGRYTLGDEALDREAFNLRPGEITPLITTPQGHAVFKCDKRIPPDNSVSMDAVRDKLIKEVLEKKVQAQMQGVMKAL